jgi:membrane protease subunit HflK
LKVAGAVAFLLLSLMSLRRLRVGSRLVARLDKALPIRVTGARSILFVIVIAVVLYASSGLFAVQPGERGIVKRFGAVHRAHLEPGLHYAVPWPFELVDRVSVGRVRRTVLGFKVDPVSGRLTGETNERESWTLAGDENITDIKTAVHWSVAASESDILRFAYGVGDHAALVAGVVQASMREVIGGESINRIFTGRRQAVERAIAQRAQERLTAYASGIRIDSFVFLDAHAPAPVHEAFRDVAGAMEDKAARVNQARADEARIVPAARGQALQGREEAAAYASRTVLSARGEAERFLDMLAPYGAWPGVTTARLYYETLDAVLPGVPKYIKPPGLSADDIEIWFVEPETARRVPGLDRGLAR